MTNRQMVMVKLIQLSDEQFAELLNDEMISSLTNGALCKECRERNNGERAIEKDSTTECPFDLVEWLQKKAS